MRRFLTPRWLLGHVAVVVVVIAMLELAWWQLGRARGGNALSIGYALEWPVFAGFAIFFWVKTIRRAHAEATSHLPQDPANPQITVVTQRESAEAPVNAAAPGNTTAPGNIATPVNTTAPANIAQRLAAERSAARERAREHATESAHNADPETAEYNHYLAWLNADPRRQPADYPGPS